ncbi:MAG: PilZ domain-containing protein [Deltaproteobacteria bacterium]|nr:PilZ domain-containing protein [Deltaproteobacteria bacterium]
MYERAVLIFDHPHASLGDIAVGLISMGIHPHYANNLDDAIWLASEHRTRIGALAAPTTLLVDKLELIRKEVLAQNGVPIACAIPIGSQPSPSELEKLANAGVRWGVFDPHTPRDLRFIIALAMSSSDKSELRRDPRVPCELPVDVTTVERTFRASLIDLSTGGAYIASRSPLKPGTPLTLAFEIDTMKLSVKAEVKWRTSLDGGFAGWLDAGMGVEFSGVAYEAKAAIRRHVTMVTQRFELKPAAAPAPKK